MSTPHPKIIQAVGIEVEEGESGSYNNDKGLCSVVSFFFSNEP